MTPDLTDNKHINLWNNNIRNIGLQQSIEALSPALPPVIAPQSQQPWSDHLEGREHSHGPGQDDSAEKGRWQLAPPAVQSKRRGDARLLVLSRATGAFTHARLNALHLLLRAGDLLVVNDAATLPGSLAAVHVRTGAPVELRLMACLDPGFFAREGEGASGVASVRQQTRAARGERIPLHWLALVFGAGDWRVKTEDRPLPPALVEGDRFRLETGAEVGITLVRAASNRLVELAFLPHGPEGVHPLHDIYQNGRPIQYAYHQAPLDLWDHQTLFAAHPVALEPPSAAMHLNWQTVLQLLSHGIQVEALTHATGISSTGAEALDRLLPVPEHSFIPRRTADAIAQTRARGGRVIALGTGVVRALEDAAFRGQVRTGARVATLKLSPSYSLQVVDGILTGLHTLDSSHLQLLGAFVAQEWLERAYADAFDHGYLWHEYGDVNLIL